MQKKKEQIYNNILNVAKKEFINNSFNKTSMRVIAKRVGISLSNIYNYFESKDDIYVEILKPVIKALNNLQDSHNEEKHLTLDVFISQELLNQRTEVFVDLITRYREDLKLLFFSSNGSSLESYTEEYIERHTETGIEYMKLMKEKYPELNNKISNFFIHTMSSWWMTNMTEMVMHDLSRDELEEFVHDYLEFSTAGWKKIMKVK